MFNFESLNKERLFDFDCSEIRGIYTNCKKMFEEHGGEKIFRVHGFYPNEKGIEFAYTAALDDTYLNCPPHMNRDIEKIRADKSAVSQINRGELGISFYTYKNKITLKSGKEIVKDCYAFNFHTIDPEEYDEEESLM